MDKIKDLFGDNKNKFIAGNFIKSNYFRVWVFLHSLNCFNHSTFLFGSYYRSRIIWTVI